MTTLLDTINDLEEKAKKATPKYEYRSMSVYGLRVLNGEGKVLVRMGPASNFRADAEYIAACSPETVLALITALREAGELAKDLATRRVLCEDGKATMYLHNVPTVSVFKNEALDIGQKARDWLAKYPKGEK